MRKLPIEQGQPKSDNEDLSNYRHHMAIHWHDFYSSDNVTPAQKANLVRRLLGALAS